MSKEAVHEGPAERSDRRADAVLAEVCRGGATISIDTQGGVKAHTIAQVQFLFIGLDASVDR